MFGAPGPTEELLFSHAHGVELLSDGNVIMYDNGNDRRPQHSQALELYIDPVAQVAEEAWSWTEPEMFDYWGGNVDRLPNGNTLIVNVEVGRLIEVTPEGEIVWEMFMKRTFGPNHSIYTCQRVPYE
jgi:hypothetical protein